ncbi:uncharacterized protein G2W53_005688 [Senna tora]|uniref:Uncharacterized protein n=1 Tax=Senna tora TaxID=362788 RepID=A0A835CBH3_9FABA|nr:uncharacterized protein G2W53_005688 [Senna tora]
MVANLKQTLLYYVCDHNTNRLLGLLVLVSPKPSRHVYMLVIPALNRVYFRCASLVRMAVQLQGRESGFVDGVVDEGGDELWERFGKEARVETQSCG